MGLLYRNQINQSSNNRLSATIPQKTELNVNLEQKRVLQTRLQQKMLLKIYIEDNKFYIEHTAAYALGLIKTRAVMLGKPKLFEITSEMHEKLKKNNAINIEYVKIGKKGKVKVYLDSAKYCIDCSTAYALGWLSTEQFFSTENDYYYVDNDDLKDLNANYDLEFCAFNLHDEMIKK